MIVFIVMIYLGMQTGWPIWIALGLVISGLAFNNCCKVKPNRRAIEYKVSPA